jgi:hypothetical protein
VFASTRGVTKRDDRGHRLSFVVVNDPYLERATPVAARQLQLAGIRLARLLNDAFDRELRL